LATKENMRLPLFSFNYYSAKLSRAILYGSLIGSLNFLLFTGSHVTVMFNSTTTKHSQYAMNQEDDNDNEMINYAKKYYFRYVPIGFLLEECKDFVNATIAKKECNQRRQMAQSTGGIDRSLLLFPDSMSDLYTIDNATVVTREGFCGFPVYVKNFRSVFSQAAISGIIRSTDPDFKGEYDGREIYALATSLNCKPFKIDYLFFVEDGKKVILYHEKNEELDQLNKYYRSRDIIQSVFRDGHKVSCEVVKDDTFTTQDNKANYLLGISKPYFEYYRLYTFKSLENVLTNAGYFLRRIYAQFLQRHKVSS